MDNNIFEEGNWDRQRQSFDNLIVSEAKGVFSKYGIALFLFTLVSYAVILLLQIFTLFLAPDVYLSMFGPSANVYVQLFLSVAPMYLIGFPVFYLIIHKMPTNPREKKKISFKEMLVFVIISEGSMLIGNYIGQYLNLYIGTALGKDIENSLSELVSETPMWLIILVTVIIGPIIEEMMFRKFLIDRTSQYGDLFAIIVSAIAFGLFHGNFYQFFYATMLGLILGYVYTKSGDVKYPIILHMTVNFLGAVPPLLLTDAMNTAIGGLGIPESAEAMKEYVISMMAILTYSLVNYAFIGGTIAILIYAWNNHKIEINKKAEIKLPHGTHTSVALANVGSILFLITSIALFALNIFFS